jgi:hypothetical protein
MSEIKQEIGEDRCTCQSEQYSFSSPVLIWKDQSCPVHGGDASTKNTKADGIVNVSPVREHIPQSR